MGGLGRSLGIATVAAGVETTAQHDLLRAEGYLEAQGFRYGRPGNLDSVRALLAKDSPPVIADALRG